MHPSKKGGGGTYLLMSPVGKNKEGRDVPGDVRRGKKPMHPSKQGGGGTYLMMSAGEKNLCTRQKKEGEGRTC
jgi:hypothetical protein